MRDCEPQLPKLYKIVFDYLETNHLLGGSTSDVSMRHAAVEAIKHYKQLAMYLKW